MQHIQFMFPVGSALSMGLSDIDHELTSFVREILHVTYLLTAQHNTECHVLHLSNI